MTARTCKRLICRLMVGVLLFAQLAVAAYACPGIASVLAAAQQPAVVAPVMDCHRMMAEPPGNTSDDDAPNLCAEHCRYGQQSDQTRVPAMAPALLTALYVVDALSPSSAGVPRVSFAADRRPAESPPLAILHCCFRI